MTPRFRIGTSGWVYPHWRGVFYPETLPQSGWFAFYASAFSTVEINNTFYRLPGEDAWRHWHEAAPEGFVYAVKGSRFITHIKRLRPGSESIDLFTGRARLLGEHLGPILWQLHPGHHRDLDRLRSFLELLPRDLRHVFEFRHASWFSDEVYALLREFDAGFCAYHMVDHATPLVATADFAYMRFHGSGDLYGGRYSDDELRAWADRLSALPVEEVFVYFNNDAYGHAVANARTLIAFTSAD
ncbi:MAG TPA: DUF72 domain-containing protein [Dehalococcoidia bacterium]|nr:DUF72 domain-containing protein [Dehalococcoidia bacterium]